MVLFSMCFYLQFNINDGDYDIEKGSKIHIKVIGKYVWEEGDNFNTEIRRRFLYMKIIKAM